MVITRQTVIDALQTLKIIHLSDLHLGERNKIETNVILQSLLKDLSRRLVEWKVEAPYLAISGDLTFSGRKEEFDLVSEFIARVSDKTQIAGTIFCPGNHDLNWSQHTSGNVDLMEDLIERGDEALQRIKKRFGNERERDQLRAGMTNYYDFIAKQGVAFSSYLFSLQSIMLERFKINFVGFNSSYLFCSKHNYYGFVGESQLERGFDEANTIGTLPDDFRVFNISLIHHPFQAITPVSQIETENMVKSRSDVILNGHVHNLKIYIDLTASLLGPRNTRGHPIISGARCVYDEVNDPHVIPGYSIIDLGFEEDKVRHLGIYEIRFDKATQDWYVDPNNPSLDVPIPLLSSSGQNSSSISRLRVVDNEETERWGWKMPRVLEEMGKLDNECILGLAPSEEGTIEQWLPIRVQHPDSWRLIADDSGNVEGYWSYVALFDEDFELAKKGELQESLITIDRVPEFELPGRYHLYFVMMALRPKYRHTEAIHMLYHSFFSVMEKLAESDVYFDDVLTNAYTPNGVSVCKSFGMRPIGNHVNQGMMYYTNFHPLPKVQLLREHPNLVTLYRKEFADSE